MSKKLLILIIIFTGFALAGIIYVQLYYIKIAFEQNEVHFDQKVNDALQAFVDKLEQKETVEIIHEKIKRNTSNPINYKSSNKKTGNNRTFFFEFNDSLVHDLVLTSESVNLDFDNDDSIDVQPNNYGTAVSIGGADVYDTSKMRRNNNKHRITQNITTFTHKNGTKIIQQSWTSNDDTIIYLNNSDIAPDFDYKVDSNKVFVVKKDKFKQKANKVKDLIQKMEDETTQKVRLFRNEIDYKLIDSLLNISFTEKDIALPYEYTVFSNLTKGKGLPKSNGFDSTNAQKKFQTNLFPNDIIPKSDKLVVYFPGRKDHLMKSLSILLPSSLFFSLIVIVAFSISIMMVIRQKKISDIKSDFINNMTHEFKTPIATISLAADSIINPKVIDDKSKIEHFTRIIKEENKRMNLQVERILQMSLLDKSEMDLNLYLLDIHQIIEKAVEKMAMQISKFNGIISLSLHASNTQTMIDEIHFINVIHNLIDNALKYSIGIPEIIISTHQVNHGIMLSFEDKGIGLSKEQQSKVFEKFYRVSKGNIHNIKGFGLGLSYVKAIVEALGGRISLKSELNKGSRFDIFIPQKQKENGNQHKIFLVEDDLNFGGVLKSYLEMDNFEVTWIDDGQKAIATFKDSDFSICILDVMLPNMDGFSIAKKMKEIRPEVPLIFLTAKTLKADILHGYQLGADDYITKPFDSELLLYKIRAIIKRNKDEHQISKDEIYEIGKYSFDYFIRQIIYQDINIKLSPKEADLLKMLCVSKDKVLMRADALKTIWGDDNYFTTRSMDVYISKLRKYLKDDPNLEIENIHSSGYRLRVSGSS